MGMSQIRKTPHTAEFKFRVAIAAIKGDKTIPALCQEFGVVSSQIYKWKNALINHGQEVFKEGTSRPLQENHEIEKLHATIGRLKVENDFLSKILGKSP